MSDEKTYEGTCVWFKNYGFLQFEINGVKQKDIFVHYSAILTENEGEYRTLKAGEKVSFQFGKNRRDELIAVNVKKLG
jgi:cold shock CspA family protein